MGSIRSTDYVTARARRIWAPTRGTSSEVKRHHRSSRNPIPSRGIARIRVLPVGIERTRRVYIIRREVPIHSYRIVSETQPAVRVRRELIVVYETKRTVRFQ